ncbi:MAG: VOC family protein [Chloroflexi bacterium]|nr:VOC family protein [Chloroflexota bacterium]
MASRFTELIVDCLDPERVANFWMGVLDYRVTDRGPRGEIELSGSEPAAPKLVFVRVPEPKAVKNRLHVDVNPVGNDQDAELRRLLALGARPVDVGQTPSVSWVVLADPEDNEFCLLGKRVG